MYRIIIKIERICIDRYKTLYIYFDSELSFLYKSIPDRREILSEATLGLKKDLCLGGNWEDDRNDWWAAEQLQPGTEKLM